MESASSASDDQPPTGILGENKSASLYTALIGMIKFSQKYHSTNFPNPERLHCPPQKTLLSLIKSGKLPDNQLRSHLYSCSECFRDYRGALAAYRNQADVQAMPRWRVVIDALLPKQRWACAGAISVLLILLAGVQLWQRYQQEAAEQRHAYSDLARVEEAIISADNPLQKDEPLLSTAAPSPTASEVSSRSARSACRKAHTKRTRLTQTSERTSIAVTRGITDLRTSLVPPVDHSCDIRDASVLLRNNRPRLVGTLPPAPPSVPLTIPPARVRELTPSERANVEPAAMKTKTDLLIVNLYNTLRKASRQRRISSRAEGTSNIASSVDQWGKTLPARRLQTFESNKPSPAPKKY